MEISGHQKRIPWLLALLGAIGLAALGWAWPAGAPAQAASPGAFAAGRAAYGRTRSETVEYSGAIRSLTVYSETVTTVLLSNEAPGRLIDDLVAAGHGEETIYEILGYLKTQSGGVISEAFQQKVYNAPAGSEVFTAKVRNYAGLEGAVEICADGTLHTRPVRAGDYRDRPGYGTVRSTDGSFSYTYAEDAAQHIYTGSTTIQVEPNVYNYNYRAFAIAWQESYSIYLPLALR